jgi:predicted nucleotide-binding protein (sugar kinase/HSP70/actin superfamily)
MRVKMSKEEVVSMYKILDGISKQSWPVEFGYAIAKNKRILKPEVEAIEEALQPSEEYNQYDVRRRDLCIKYASRNESDSPIIKNGSYIIDPEKEKSFKTQITKLNKEHEDIIEKHKEAIQQGKDLLKEEIELDLHAIKYSSLPEKLNGVVIEHLLDIMIGEPSEEE